MAWRGCGVFVDPDVGLLPLYVPAYGAGGSCTALLDQYGGGGDLHSGGRHLDRTRRALSGCRRDRAVRDGLDFVLLGDRHVLDPHAAAARRLAISHLQLTARLWPALLGWSI